MANAVDKEQIEFLKRWWQEYGTMIVCAVVVGLLLGYGWRFWHQKQVDYAARASVVYETIASASPTPDLQTFQQVTATLQKDYAKSPYAAFASLLLAKQLVLAQRWTEATQALSWAATHSRVPEVRAVAHIRLARVLIFLKKPHEALQRLNLVTLSAYQPMVNTVKADAYRALNQPQAARDAYHLAETGYQALGISNPFLSE